MRKLFKLLGFLLVPLLVVGAAYGYYWYQVKTSVDEIVDAAAPYAKISYARVVAGIDGSAGVSGVQITPAGSKDSLLIGSLLFKAPDPLFYLDAEKTLREGEWPEHLALELKSLNVTLDADFLARLEAMGQSFESPTETAVDTVAGFETLACGDVERFDLATTRAMKYDRLNMDMRVSMDFAPRSQSVRLRSDVTVDGMAQTGFYIDVSLASNVLSVGALVQSQPTLERVTLDYSDLGYNARRNSFCALRAGFAPDEYPQQHSTLVQAELRRLGWSVSDALIKAYGDLQRPQAILQVIAEPPPGFGAQSIGGITSPEQLLDLLNIRVSVNGATQDLSGVSWSLSGGEEVAAVADGSPVAEPASDLVAILTPEDDLVVELDPPPPVPPQVVTLLDPAVVQVMPGIVVRAKEIEKSYKPTAVQQVHGYTGQPVILRTYFGRRIEGTLVRVSGGSLEVEQRLDRGVAIFPIAADKVAELSVYR